MGRACRAGSQSMARRNSPDSADAPSQATAGALLSTAQMLRQAMEPDRLRRVLRLAGADEVVGDAPQALREAAADALARRLVRRNGGTLQTARQP